MEYLKPGKIELEPVKGIPEIKPGYNLPEIIVKHIQHFGMKIGDGDVLVIAHKIVSKSEGRVIDLSEIEPGSRAKKLAEKLNKDPRKVQVILNESKKIIKIKYPGVKNEGLIICEHRLGFISANACVDESNTGKNDTVILLPSNPDKTASRIRRYTKAKLKCDVGVIITDTLGRPWRVGIVNVAIGVSGLPAVIDLCGKKDYYGRKLKSTIIALADEIAAASGLVMGKSRMNPVVLIRGLKFKNLPGNSSDLIREEKEDIFR